MNDFESFQRVLLLLVTFRVFDLPDMSISYFREICSGSNCMTNDLGPYPFFMSMDAFFLSPLSTVLIFMILVLILTLALEYDAFHVIECFPRL